MESSAPNPPQDKPHEKFFIPLPSKLLPIIPRLGPATALYLWCIDKTTAEYITDAGKRIGTVNYEHPVKDDYLATFFGCTKKTVSNWRNTLESEGLIVAKSNGQGYRYAVMDSEKLNHRPAKHGPLPAWAIVQALETCEVA